MQDWQRELIGLYLFIDTQCSRLAEHLQRHSNNWQPRFSDTEVLTVYLFGIQQQQRTTSQIHRYVQQLAAGWFPALPSYTAYVERLNRLSHVLPLLLETLMAVDDAQLVDALPIAIAQQPRSDRARVAAGLATKGFCASKKRWYYGVRLHLSATARPGTLPMPSIALLAPASVNEVPVFEQMRPLLGEHAAYADRAYACFNDAQTCFTPIKKRIGQDRLGYLERVYSRSVSRLRQPIESLFHWIHEKTGLQDASKVRSINGLIIHVFGRLLAAYLLLSSNS